MIDELEPRTLFSGTPIQTSNFIPLDFGNSWSYSANSTVYGVGPSEVGVVGQTVINSVTTQKLRFEPGAIDDTEDRYMTSDANGLRLYRVTTTNPDSSIQVTAASPITMLPNTAVTGTTYNFSGDLTWLGLSGDVAGLMATGTMSNGQATVYDPEQVVTTYGTFMAYRFEFSFSLSATGDATISATDSETWWLVEGLGPVRIDAEYHEIIDGSPYDHTITATIASSNLLDNLDFGDAPDTYGTTFANDGARHLNGSLRFGTLLDPEGNGQPSGAALADDNTDTDDEDGVSFLTSIIGGQNATVRVNASDTAYLNAWFDFNDDGDFNDAGEQIFTDEPLSSGNNDLQFEVPDTVADGSTFARFRLSTLTGLGPTGYAPDGEVEDYIAYTQAAPTTSTKTDFNADGYDDVVFRNSSNGQNILWLMQGASKVGSVGLPTVADTHWTI
ncbi:MAG: hypothetical protein GC164_07800, partial [Phycisphaera sp.]|nr:hypothetical protein [Phycisphaera sp.]